MKNLYLLFFSVIASLSVIGQSTDSTYSNKEGFGGPKTVGAQLEVDNGPRFENRIPVKHTKPWYDFKADLSKKTGIEFGLNYTSIFIYSTNTISDNNRNNASGGIFDVQAGWTLINRKKGKNTGKLFIKINSRHSYNGPNSTAPMFHGINESGYYGLPATGYTN